VTVERVKIWKGFLKGGIALDTCVLITFFANNCLGARISGELKIAASSYKLIAKTVIVVVDLFLCGFGLRYLGVILSLFSILLMVLGVEIWFG